MLRPFTLDDVGAHGRIFSDRLVTRFLPRGPYPADQARDVALRTVSYFIEHWKQHGFGVWAVLDRPSGALIGQCGLNTLEETPEVEVLYLFDRPFWGHGLATEAAQAAVNVGFDQVGLQRIVGLTHPDNVASQRVLQKIGFHYKKRARFFGIDVFYFALDRDERAITPQSQ
ncbi:MAG TPA: GNAT family N-acetyltransferase [Candidatus Acidoferrales bacterium]|nr:GNAT family N-acetyltransferase [Candidatus Acidoferrales bacterium]